MEPVPQHPPRSLFIDYEVASLGQRIGAFLIDLLLIAVYYTLLFIFNTEAKALTLWTNLLLALPALLYHLLSEIFLHGQSLGKRQFRLKVVRLDGTRPTTKSYLLRWLLRPLDIWLYGSVAIITILINGKGQRLGDLAAGTTLVKYSKAHEQLEELLYQEADNPPAGVRFPAVSRLHETEISLIRETLRNYRLTANAQAVQLLAEQLQEQLALETDMPPLRLLNTLLKDHEQMRGRA